MCALKREKTPAAYSVYIPGRGAGKLYSPNDLEEKALL